MFWDQIPKKTRVFQNSKKFINLPKYFWNFGILENSRFFWYCENSKKTRLFWKFGRKRIKTMCFLGICYEIPKKPLVVWCFGIKFQTNLVFFWIFQNSKKKTSSFPKFQKFLGKLIIFLEFWKTRGFLEFGFTKLKNTPALQKISKSKAMRISVVCNVSASFVLNCLHLSIFCFHLLIRSVHFLTRSSYLRTTFSLFSIHLSIYIFLHPCCTIDWLIPLFIHESVASCLSYVCVCSLIYVLFSPMCLLFIACWFYFVHL